MAFPHKSQKIAETIRRWFAEKRFKPGDRFPSDMKLAKQFGVNHITVRAALKGFVEAGLLDRRVGAGTVVRAQAAKNDTGTGAGMGSAVGVAIPDGSHSFYAEILRAVEGTLLGTGRSLLLGYTWEIAQRERQVLEGWVAQNVKHVIVAATVPDASFYESLRKKGVRLVFLDRRVPGLDLPSVTTRDDEGVSAIVRLLVAQGHRRIVHLAGPTTIWTAQVRRKMFLDSMEAAGCKPNADTIVQAGFFIEDGYRATREVLAARPAPEAIFAANDPAAVGAIRALEEHGLKVPDDVSVVGYGDDVDLSRHFGLTTMRQFPELMGVEAVRLLLAHKELGAADSVELHPEMVIRASTAAPRSVRSGSRSVAATV